MTTIRNLLRALGLAAATAVLVLGCPAGLGLLVLTSGAASEYKVGALLFLVAAMVVAFVAAMVVAYGAYRDRRHQARRALMHEALDTQTAVIPRVPGQRGRVYGTRPEGGHR